MKNYFYIIFLFLCSCSQVAIDPTSNEEIKFSTHSVDTRAVSTYSESIKDMGVFAYYTGQGLENTWNKKGGNPILRIMENMNVYKSSENIWKNDTIVYWPLASDCNTSFFAYSPYATDENGISIEKNMPTDIKINYTVSPTLSLQTDLLIAEPKENLNRTHGKVGFNFKHVLTQLTFNAKLSNAPVGGANVRVQEIKIENLNSIGTFIINDPTIAQDQSSLESYVLIQGNGLRHIDIAGTYLEVSDPDNRLMLIPQQVEDNVLVTIKTELTIGGSTKVEKTFIKNLKNDFNVSELKVGKNISFNFTFDYKMNNLIIETTTVELWKDGGTTDWGQTN